MILKNPRIIFFQNGGEEGSAGRPGKDAEYCPCPPKSGTNANGGGPNGAGNNGNYRQRRA
jgi:hypothetical protein